MARERAEQERQRQEQIARGQALDDSFPEDHCILCGVRVDLREGAEDPMVFRRTHLDWHEEMRRGRQRQTYG